MYNCDFLKKTQQKTLTCTYSIHKQPIITGMQMKKQQQFNQEGQDICYVVPKLAKQDSRIPLVVCNPTHSFCVLHGLFM